MTAIVRHLGSLELGFVCHPHVHRGRPGAVDLSHSGARSRATDGMTDCASSFIVDAQESSDGDLQH
jgi:hypothetical protein